VYTASKLRAPLVPFGIGYDRPWRLSTWDRFAIPRPYSRVRILVGPKTWIPEDLDREELETHRRAVERQLLDLTTEAERWAADGGRRDGQFKCRPRAASLQPARSAEPPITVYSPPDKFRRSA
jgi:hypothetical protein